MSEIRSLRICLPLKVDQTHSSKRYNTSDASRCMVVNLLQIIFTTSKYIVEYLFTYLQTITNTQMISREYSRSRPYHICRMCVMAIVFSLLCAIVLLISYHDVEVEQMKT